MIVIALFWDKKEYIVGRPITDVIPNSKMADIMRNEYKKELVLHKYQPDCLL